MKYEQKYSELIESKEPRGERLGAGLSGTVYAVQWEDQTFAEKCFSGGGLASIVHIFFSGATNPYRYDRDAVSGAYYRRRILTKIFKLWYGQKLSVANAEFIRHDKENECLTLGCEFVDGRAPGIAAPFNRCDPSEVVELLELMSDLQKRLRNAGFTGALWQAGYGNPVALNNFLKSDDGWVMIDLESGVPALFPSNPLKLFGYYIPHAIKRLRPLFDDVNIPVLKKWLDDNRDELQEVIGASDIEEIAEEIDGLDKSQQELDKRTRRSRSIEHAFFRGRIDESQRKKMTTSWFAWLRWMLCITTCQLFSKSWNMAKKCVADLARFLRPSKLLPRIGKFFLFFISIRYRHKVGLILTRKRLFSWKDRKLLTQKETRNLNRILKKSRSEDYLTDFIFLIGIKPLAKGIQALIGFTLLSSMLKEIADKGIVEVFSDHGFSTAIKFTLFLMTGGIIRFIYTVAVSVYRRDLPWIALIVSPIPVLGNVAFPLQMLINGGRHQLIASFLIYDAFSTAGIHFPIWGGPDTRTEHSSIAFCRLLTFTRPKPQKALPAS